MLLVLCSKMWPGMEVKGSKLRRDDCERPDYSMIYSHGYWGLGLIPPTSILSWAPSHIFLSQGLHSKHFLKLQITGNEMTLDKKAIMVK